MPELANAPGAKNIGSLICTPGLRLFSSGVASAVRGMIVMAGKMYAVESNVFLAVNSDGTISAALGHLDTSAGRVSMAHNGVKSAGIGGDQICIVDGTHGYIYNTSTNTFSTITDTDFPATPKHVEFIDSYFVVTNGTMGAWCCDIYNGTSWNGLAYAPVQSAPDNVQRPLSLHEQLFFIKEYTSEVYYNSGTPTSNGFPFSRIGGAVIDYGTPAPWSVARGDNSCFFLASQRNGDGGEFIGVVELNGYVPTPISPQAITYTMSQSTDLSQCWGYCYSDGGHTFYVVTNPVDNWTFVYDATLQMWHERSSIGNSTVNRHLGNAYVYAYGMHLVGDWQTGNIYEMSHKFFTEGGNPLICTHVGQHIFDPKRLNDVFIGELQIDVESGMGLDGPASPAKAVATITDGAVTGVQVTYGGADYINLVDASVIETYNDGTTMFYNNGQPVTHPLDAVTVLFRSTDGNGSGAQGTATIQFGSITAVTVTAGGSGYTQPPEVIILGQQVQPYLGMSISKDGGKTFGPEHIRSMGNIGEYRKRVMYRQLGRAKDRVVKVRSSSPCRRIILGYYAEAQ